MRKADLDIFTELKSQSEERAEKVGIEREMKDLIASFMEIYLYKLKREL